MISHYKQSNWHPFETPAPCREERFMHYRCAVATAFLSRTDANPEESATHIETVAHAMLAAERPADAPAHNGAGHTGDDMGDEIVALRGGLTMALRLLEEYAYSVPKSDVRPLYALLPPDEKGTDDGKA